MYDKCIFLFFLMIFGWFLLPYPDPGSAFLKWIKIRLRPNESGSATLINIIESELTWWIDQPRSWYTPVVCISVSRPGCRWGRGGSVPGAPPPAYRSTCSGTLFTQTVICSFPSFFLFFYFQTIWILIVCFMYNWAVGVHWTWRPECLIRKLFRINSMYK